LADGGEGEEDALTAAGVVLGTPKFMAPEQGRDARRSDSRSDLYSLGCTFYYLLTGRAPVAERAPAAGAAPAPARGVAELPPDVPPAVATVVHQLLARRPEDRYPSADALIEALDQAAAATPPGPARKATGRRWRWLAVAGVGLLLLAAAVALFLWRAPPGPPVRVRSLEVQHFAKVGRFDEPRGVLGGAKSFSARLGDGVTVHGELSAPAYCYLIAYRPDGTEELCFPEDANAPPPRTDRPRYPSVKPDETYGLEEGEGLMAFALVVSRHPLPAYAEWRKQRGASPWRKADAQRDVVWRYDGRELLAVTPEEPAGARAKGRRLGDAGPLAELVGWLRQAPEVEAVAAVAFPVLPAEKD
jgi:hypothetical protein